MGKTKLYPIPTKDPVSGGELIVTELANEDSGVTVRGRFEIPRYSRLEPDHQQFLETFLRCRGMLNSVEKELGISYPTVRGKLDALLEALELSPVKEEKVEKEKPRKDKSLDKKRKILEQLERGEITAEEAKAKIKGVEA
ncbi:MAG TPA: DUF2089 domain-containing protein [Fimbriimonadaceae bacterium]|nr:DUF2089 domain-containing protein [Fimbriimonadaceae bacterium]